MTMANHVDQNQIIRKLMIKKNDLMDQAQVQYQIISVVSKEVPELMLTLIENKLKLIR